MSEPAQKCANNANFKQKFNLKPAFSCCFSFKVNLDFLDFLQKQLYNIDYLQCSWQVDVEI